eukprot:NODE_5383_length_581_cov_36.139098_g4669_i0.p1 GENE.NODE_5383_length_581_cov_36.139098_g4669_i0~~NODE_5383_length_581_cov_36.139098_g4669_i0.p1  ORF type:complete len:146 (-),score=14.50 NODE_5383_length_581_cov_36.139098_g4669_i0:73-510(-)
MMRINQPKYGNPMVPIFNDLRFMKEWTKTEAFQKHGLSEFEKMHMKLPTAWYRRMVLYPGKSIPCVTMTLLLFGGWGFEFLKNILVLGKEKPPIDWNNGFCNTKKTRMSYFARTQRESWIPAERCASSHPHIPTYVCPLGPLVSV